MRFKLEQRYGAEPDAVARAYADPALYASFTDLPRAGRPEVVAHRGDDGVVELEVRWRFTADLSGAARAVIDPARLSWVEASRHDLAARRTTFRMLADHYADRFSCTGEYRFTPSAGGGAVRVVEADLRVKAPLVGRAVEGAIVSGLEEQLRAEVPAVESFLSGGG
jgi:hypothetical protein